MVPRRTISRAALSKMVYPQCQRDEVYDQYMSTNGRETKVHDPYRWLEDVGSKETKTWIEQQQRLYKEHLEQPALDAQKKSLEATLARRWNYERFSCPFKEGSRYFFYYNSGLLNQSVLYSQTGLDEEKSVLLDPNELSSDGTAALGNVKFTKDGTLMVYSVSRSGSDWRNLYIRDVATGKDFPEVLEWVKFSSMSWLPTGEGFFYSRYPKPMQFEGDVEDEEFARGTEVDRVSNQTVYFHRVGTDQSADIEIFTDVENPLWMYGAEVSHCGQYLLIFVSDSCEPVNRVFYAKLGDIEQLSIVKLIDNFDAEYDYLTNTGSMFYFKTNLAAPNYRIVKIDLNAPATVTPVIPHDSSALLEFAVCCAGDKLVVSHLSNVQPSITLFNLEGESLFEIMSSSVCSVQGLSGRKEHSELFYKVSSFNDPGVIYRFDIETQESSVFLTTSVPELDKDLLVVKQLHFKSRDGTMVPMFVFHHRDVELNGLNPTILYGYGGFNISLTPYFSVVWWTFVEQFKGVFVVANLRGGGEFGREWHQGGTKLNKQNVFDDFQAAAKYLIAEKYTSSEKLAITGGSNGGLLVAACLNQAPQLFKCVVAEVGVMDMLRFHKFTIGYAWCSDYGNAEENPEYAFAHSLILTMLREFDTLIKYSPIHNVRGTVAYPHVLLTTADHDDRVVPLHSFKLAAELQSTIGSKEFQSNPLLIRIDSKSGHGAGKPLAKTITERSEIISFIANALDVLH